MTDGHWQLEGSAAELYQRYLVPGITLKWAADLVDRVQLRGGEEVLDVACGTGVVARLAAKTGQVTGLDLNPGMLAVARGVLSEGASVNWMEGSALELPFPSRRFDAVFCQLGLQFFPDQPKALREMRRVVRESGRIARSVYSPIERTPGADAFVRALDDVLGPQASRIKRGEHSFANPAQLDVQTVVQTIVFPSVLDNADDGAPKGYNRARASGDHLISRFQDCDFLGALHARWRQVYVPTGGVCSHCVAVRPCPVMAPPVISQPWKIWSLLETWRTLVGAGA